ncbi:MAG: hypothetical protein ACPG6V_11835 [Flavobacteriales bacterium]
MLKKIIALSCIFIGFETELCAQIGIGTTSPHASSKLDVSASDKGLLIPRVALTGSDDVTTIATPTTSLLIYNTSTANTGTATEVETGFYFFDGTQWVKLKAGNEPDINYIDYSEGATINTPIYFSHKTTKGNGGGNNVFIGQNTGTNNTGSRVNALGPLAAESNTQGEVNAFGNEAARNNSGYNVNAFGYRTAVTNNQNDVNALGGEAGMNNRGGNVNLMGFSAGRDNQVQHVNAFGLSAGRNNTGDNLNAIGRESGLDNEGVNANLFGNRAGWKNTGHQVVAIGFEAASDNTGDYVIAIGADVGKANTGNNNIFIGDDLFDPVSGSENLLIGKGVDLVDPAANKQFNILDRIVSNSDGFIGIGVADPKEKLHINANGDSLQIDLLAGAGNLIGVNSEGKVYKTSANVGALQNLSANYTSVISDEYLLVDDSSGDITISLIANPVFGQKITVKKTTGGSNKVIINGNGKTMDGLATRDITVIGQFYTYIYNGTEWSLINHL